MVWLAPTPDLEVALKDDIVRYRRLCLACTEAIVTGGPICADVSIDEVPVVRDASSPGHYNPRMSSRATRTSAQRVSGKWAMSAPAKRARQCESTPA
jgi:hypothetical protein